jgi:very-short-patch-repair endonuclease
MSTRILTATDINLTYTPVINFALQQNHVPVIRSLVINNTTGADWNALEVEITVEPAFAPSWKRLYGYVKQGEAYETGAIQLNLSAQYLAELTEKVSGTINIIIRNGDELLISENRQIELLAYDQWNGLGLLPEMLAAFVTPNHPEIPKILRRASAILQSWTDNPSFDDYQSRSPDRVRKQMAAIYEAIAEQQLIYCTVPASFEESGQRIRLCDAIFANRLANCLDLSLLYAACMEAVGIHPIIIIVKGHAFTGGWLVDESFADAVNDDPSLITKRTADGISEIAIVEATCMNAGNNTSFDSAAASAGQKMLNASEFILFIDIKRARFSGIRPLPLRVQTAAGWEIIEESRQERANALPENIYAGQKLKDVDHIEISKQRLWERKLLDLTLRNSLLNIRITKSVVQFMTVNVGKLEDALADGQEFQVLPRPVDWDNSLRDAGMYQALHQSDPIAELIQHELSQKRIRSFLPEPELTNGLTSLFRASRISIEENGANTLYIGLGLLRWYETDASERPRYAPVLLVPAEIIRKSAQKGYVIRSRDEETMVNITLLEMIRQDFGITIGGLDTLPKDESGVDVKLIFNIVRQAIMAKSRWDVEEQAVLGTFSFSKFILWNDIHNNAEHLYRNKVVASLVSGKLEWQAQENADVSLIQDSQLHPANIALPISTDSSQLQAIVSSGQEKSFVLHGPPGTGKSQTITNIIANALYAGKRVLFVAAKKAALEVVEDRLESIGIGDFCLELHSNKSKKTAVLEQLKAATEVARKAAPESHRDEADRLFALRNELNTYVEVLHKKYPFGYSLFDLFSSYSRFEKGEDKVYFAAGAIAQLSPAKLTAWHDVAEELQVAGALIGQPANHPLQYMRLQQYNNQVKQDAGQLIEQLLDHLSKYQSQLVGVSRLLKINGLVKSKEQQQSLHTLVSLLLDLPDIPASLLQADFLEQTFAQVAGVAAHGQQRDKLRSALLGRYQKEVLDVPAQRILSEWNIADAKWFLPRWLGQRAIAKNMRVLSATGQIDKSAIAQDLQQVIAFRAEQDVIDKAAFLPGLLGFLWKNGDPDWDALILISDAVININRAAGTLVGATQLREWRATLSREFTEGSRAFIISNTSTLSGLLATEQQVATTEGQIQQLLGINFAALPVGIGDYTADLIDEAVKWVQHLDELKDWHNWTLTRDKAVIAGLDPLLDAYEKGNITNADLVRQFQKGFYRSAAEYILSLHLELASFNSGLFGEKIRKFREVSSKFEMLTRQELYARLAARIPLFTQEASQSSEIGMLQRVIRNNGRAMSIRKIFDGIPNLLHRLAPCMLMSPISVAQYFDAGNPKFDLVIFDEASQLPTCEAVGAIARGTNVIVVGDPKQMPPTSFFATNNFDEDNVEKEDLESILDDCLALSMPSQHLLWHYRSKHESLIAFSNAKYYDNKLLTFPSTDDITSKVSFVPVDGHYDKGKSRQNKYEAKAIIDEVIKRLSDPLQAERSIGIVTFSSVQQLLIDDMLTEVFALRPDLEKIALETGEPLFIKNLENVQGDERDVILFSIGYGPDERGKVSLNFGPVNRDGGWRRLNVAVSRARYEMKVFSTLRSDQIDLNRTSSEGVAGLKAFLAYAEKGKTALPPRASVKQKEDGGFEISIAESVRKQGYEVHSQIGCSDFRIDLGIVDKENPSAYILGVLTDGKNYHAATTSRDREIVQVDVLKSLGWNVHKIWSTEWWEKPDKVISGIMDAVTKAEESKKKATEPAVTEKAKSVPPRPEDLNNKSLVNQSVPEIQARPAAPAIPKVAEEYEVSHLDTVHTLTADDFIMQHNRGKLKTQVFNVLQTESPISKDLLIRRVLAAWGISRVTARFVNHLDGVFDQMNLTQTKTAGGNVYFWKADQSPEKYNIYRIAKTDADKRDADDLPPEEVANAIREILHNQVSLARADLVREGAKLFGFARIGANVESAMLNGINIAVNKRFATVNGERVVYSG